MSGRPRVRRVPASVRAPRVRVASASSKRTPAARDSFKLVAGGFDQYSVAGGMLKKRVCVDSISFAGQTFLKLDKRENWLCQMVTGKSRGANPLQRTKLLDALRELAASAASSPLRADAMDALGLDDAPRDAPVARVDAVSRTKAHSSLRLLPPDVRAGLMPTRLRGPSDHSAAVLSRAPGKPPLRQSVWLSAADLGWAVAYLHAEVQSGGVDYEPPSPDTRMPYFRHRDRCWVIRAKTPAGDIRRKTLTVPLTVPGAAGKRALSRAEFDAERHRAASALIDWRDLVERGVDIP